MTGDGQPVDRAAARRALDLVSVPGWSDSPAASSVAPVGDGVNEVFRVDRPDGDRLVVKFATHSEPAHLLAGVAAYRLLDAYTDLPVPTVHAFEPDPDGLPPFLVLDHVPGESLTDGFRDVDPPAARALGAVVREFARVPAEAVDGYGFLREFELTGSGPRAVAGGDDWADALVEYAARLYDDPPAHDALAAVAPAVPDYLRAHRDRLPADPDPSLVVTDLSPANLLSPDGEPPSDGVDGLTGVLDLERAKVGPPAFTAVNAEYLATRYVTDPRPIREALYEPLPFGPDVPARDLYLLVALGRSVSALPTWYDPSSEVYRQRGEAIAARIERLVE